MPSVISITITAPSIGWFLASTTLPLTPPVWAAAGLENAKRPSTTAQIASDPRLKRSPIIGNLRLIVSRPGGFAPPDPPSPSLAGAQGPAPLRRPRWRADA